MIELIYEQKHKIILYQLYEGIKRYINEFDDREDMLIYIEERFAYAKLIVKGN